MLREYTVILLHDDTGHVVTETGTATDPHAAMRIVAQRHDNDTQIIGAIKGRVTICPPCEDSGKAAWVGDLKGD